MSSAVNVGDPFFVACSRVKGSITSAYVSWLTTAEHEAYSYATHDRLPITSDHNEHGQHEVSVNR